MSQTDLTRLTPAFAQFALSCVVPTALMQVMIPVPTLAAGHPSTTPPPECYRNSEYARNVLMPEINQIISHGDLSDRAFIEKIINQETEDFNYDNVTGYRVKDLSEMYGVDAFDVSYEHYMAPDTRSPYLVEIRIIFQENRKGGSCYKYPALSAQEFPMKLLMSPIYEDRHVIDPPLLIDGASPDATMDREYPSDLSRRRDIFVKWYYPLYEDEAVSEISMITIRQ